MALATRLASAACVTLVSLHHAAEQFKLVYIQTSTTNHTESKEKLKRLFSIHTCTNLGRLRQHSTAHSIAVSIFITAAPSHINS